MITKNTNSNTNKGIDDLTNDESHCIKDTKNQYSVLATVTMTIKYSEVTKGKVITMLVMILFRFNYDVYS